MAGHDLKPGLSEFRGEKSGLSELRGESAPDPRGLGLLKQVLRAATSEERDEALCIAQRASGVQCSLTQHLQNISLVALSIYDDRRKN